MDTKSDKSIVIFDLDGTLCDCEHRLHHLSKQKKDWDAFHSACALDSPNTPLVRLLKLLKDTGHTIAICSGRPDTYQDITRAWLAKYAGTDFQLYMRKAGDHRPDTIVKREMLRKIGKDNVLFVIDDRKSVVDMWRSEGLLCLQCAEGNF